MPNATQNHQRAGRIYPHQRNTNDITTTLGANLEEPSNLQEKFNETEKFSMSVACRRNYRQRIRKIIEFWKEKDPGYYQVGVRAVGEEDQANPTKYFFDGKFKEDICYAGLNSKFLLHFMVSSKNKEGGKMKSIGDLRKYKDAVMWGAKISGEQLPTTFYVMLDAFLSGYKKEFQKGKKEGLVDESAADPIPISVYKLILRWALEENNLLVWVWTLVQWSCVARSASVDPLALHNIKIGLDSIVAKYDDSKADKAGERLSEKNIYANPLDWTKCLWTALGIWIAMRRDKLVGNERLFLDKNVKEGSAASKYCEQLLTIVRKHKEEVTNLMKMENFNAYGWRKGGATYALSGTTAPPSIPSVARRGEWSIGSVLDCYWHFGSVGDQYLGRVLAGLDPNSQSFDCLPPHWKTGRPMSDETIKQGMEMTFGTTLEEHPTHVGLLTRLLACMVYHSDHLLRHMVKFPGHDFTKLAILHDTELLGQLKALVTTEATDEMPSATGIPPHIIQTRQLVQLTEQVGVVVTTVELQSESLVTNVIKALENRAWEAGHVTGERLRTLLTEFKDETIGAVNNQLEQLKNGLKEIVSTSTPTDDNDGDGEDFLCDDDDGANRGTNAGQSANVFSYDGKFFAVPKDFQFPKVNLRDGLRLWLCGHRVSTETNERVRRFRALKPLLLPKHLRNTFKIGWCGIFRYLDDGVLSDRLSGNNLLSEEDLEGHYDACITFLKSRVSYCFAKGDPTSWRLSTWSNRVQRSTVEKKGTEADVRNLEEPTYRNRKLGEGRRRNRQLNPEARYGERQERRQTQRHQQPVQRDNQPVDDFATAFAHIPVDEEAMVADRARLQADLEERGNRGLVRTSGLFTVARRDNNQVQQNRGDNSAVSRDEYSRVLGATLGDRSPHCCAVSNCTMDVPNAQMYHCKIDDCENKVHHLCASESGLTGDNEMIVYCSMECKNKN